MNKTTTNTTSKTDAPMRREYRLDYTKSRPNRFASASKGVIVLLESDVAKVFRDSEQVNTALRAIMNAVPRRRAVK